MINLEITPYVRIGPIVFGMSRGEVRIILGGEPVSFEKEQNYAGSGIDRCAFDYFRESGIKIEYTDDERCSSVEVGLAANPVFQDWELLGHPFEEIRAWFRSLDSDLRSDESGFTSLKFGIGVYAPHSEERPGEPGELVIVFEKGYYDELIEEGLM